MSLENSQYTYYELQFATKKVYGEVVDKIVKKADEVTDDDDDESGPAVPLKRGRYTQGAGSQNQRNHIRPVSGTILEVVLEDFLCHSHMKVVLNKEINFIVGRNGSGKSAILTAIVVALGGSASVTGRGTALKDFIKHGSNSARVTCVISNAGALSYKKEVYGEKISVVRTLQGAGGSAIKLKSENGKLISSKMEDLRAMTLQLGIQVDNPISVLDQNTARHFLAQSKPENKFELFMRATNLESLQRIYVEITQHIDSATREIKKKEKQLTDNNAEVEEAKRKFQLVENLERDRVKSTNLKMELLWAEVRDTVISLRRVKKDLSKAQQEKEHLEKLLATAENTETEPILQKIESLKAGVKAFEEEKKVIENEIKDLKVQYSGLLQRQKKLDQEKSLKERKIKEEEKVIDEYKAEIRSQEKKMLPEHVDKIRQQKEERLELQRKIAEYDDVTRSKEVEFKELQQQFSRARDILEQNQRRKRSHEEELKTQSTRLQGLESNESNLSVFGPGMPELVREIERCKQFKKKPIGPLGSYVKVKDPKWTLAVESAMKSRLNTFLVENKDDERLLQSLVKKTCTRGQKPSVTRCAFPTHTFDTSRTTARTSEYCNVLDIVEISNLVARNMLVDFCSLERIMLVPTDDECYNLLSNVRSVPRNCMKAYTLKADSYMPAPCYGSYASNQRSATVLQSSRADSIRQTQQSMKELQEKLQSVQQSIATTSNDSVNIRQQLENCRVAMKRNNTDKLAIQARLERLKDIEQPDTNSVSVLREELTSREQELLNLRSGLAEIPAKLVATEAERTELKLKGTDAQNKLKEVNDMIDNNQMQQRTYRDQLDELHSAKANKKRKLDQVSKQEDQLTVSAKELEGKHDKAREAAEKLENHICSTNDAQENFQSQSNTDRNVKVIDQELRSLTKKLESFERTLGQDAATVEVDFRDKLNAYNAVKNNVLLLKHNAEFMKLALDQRKSLYHTQKRLMSAVVSHQFTRVLRYRNCTGSVRVNFEKKSLDISVGPVDEGERTGLGTNSLSGGERSYATIAFVIALWNVTELPFYFLDEFDVFMDMLNRQTVLTLLLKCAKKKTGYQFGFLTPQDTTSISASKRITVLKLADPRIPNPE